MNSGKLQEFVKSHAEKSAKYWKDKPALTREQLDAIDRFAKKKTGLVKVLFDTPEKIDLAKSMIKKV